MTGPCWAGPCGSPTGWWTTFSGRDEPDPLLAPLLVSPGQWPGEIAPTVRRALDGGVTLLYAQERPGSAALSYLASGLARAHRDVLAIDLALLAEGRTYADWPPSAPAKLACGARHWSSPMSSPWPSGGRWKSGDGQSPPA